MRTQREIEDELRKLTYGTNPKGCEMCIHALEWVLSGDTPDTTTFDTLPGYRRLEPEEEIKAGDVCEINGKRWEVEDDACGSSIKGFGWSLRAKIARAFAARFYRPIPPAPREPRVWAREVQMDPRKGNSEKRWIRVPDDVKLRTRVVVTEVLEGEAAK